MMRTSRLPAGNGAFKFNAMRHNPLASCCGTAGHERCGTPPAAPRPNEIAPSSFGAAIIVEIVSG